VNPDGKILDGVSTGPDGQLPLSLTFVGPTIGSSIEINSDKPVYDLKEPIEISGQITNVVNDRSDAFIEVYGPENEQVFSQTVSVNPDGSFLTNFELNNDENSKGTYRTIASYVEANDEITFEVGAEQPIAPGAAIATGAIIAAGSGGLFLLYKKGHLEGGKHMIKRLKEKVIKPHEIKTDTPSIIELRIECGLENSNDSEAFRRESSKGDNTVTGELAEMERKFSQAIDKILENRNKIKDVQTDIEFVKWCKEAGENPNKILSKISDEVIGRFLISIQPYFQNLILSQIIAIESDISVTKDRPKRIRTNVTFSLNTIQAYIELVVYNNGVRVSSTKFIFAINSYVKIKNFTVHLEEVNRHLVQMKQLKQQAQYGDEETGNFNRGYRKRIETEDLLFGISIKLPKIKIGSIEKNIEPPFDLGKKEVGIKKCVLFFHDNKDQDTMSQEKDDSDGKL